MTLASMVFPRYLSGLGNYGIPSMLVGPAWYLSGPAGYLLGSHGFLRVPPGIYGLPLDHLAADKSTCLEPLPVDFVPLVPLVPLDPVPARPRGRPVGSCRGRPRGLVPASCSPDVTGSCRSPWCRLDLAGLV